MRTKRVRYIVDILLGIGLIMLMSYQVPGEEGHERTGIVMTALDAGTAAGRCGIINRHTGTKKEKKAYAGCISSSGAV